MQEHVREWYIHHKIPDLYTPRPTIENTFCKDSKMNVPRKSTEPFMNVIHSDILNSICDVLCFFHYNTLKT